jgi:protein gp37
MNKTSIEWTDYTSNLIRYRDPEGRSVHGCIKVSAGCANCYASAWSARGLTGERDGAFTAKRQATLTPYFDDAEAQRILRTRVTGKRVFVGDMTDVFGEWVPDALLDRMFAVFAMRPDLTFQLLTKRPERMRAYLSALDIQGYLLRQARSQLGADGCLSDQVWKGLKATLTDEQTTWIKTVASTRHMSWLAVIRDFGIEPPRASGPLPNVWLGVSVEDQAAADERIPALLDTPAAVRSLSCEPLLEPVDLEPWLATGLLHWVICGGES